jgi:glucosyl-3-phosphoglycerate synthase
MTALRGERRKENSLRHVMPHQRPNVGISTWHHSAFSAAGVAAAKAGRTASAVLPARNEAATVGGIVAVLGDLVEADVLDEVIVVDSGSTDATAAVAEAAGATVVDAATVFPELGPALGKGDALWRSLEVAKGDFVIWLDADLEEFAAHYVTGLLGPLLADDRAVLCKAFYKRPVVGTDGTRCADGGGRVTELTARPALALLAPALAGLAQPLAGEYAMRREAAETVPFPTGYGVEIGVLLDVYELYGTSGIVQVDLDKRLHRNRPLAELGATAFEVLHAILERCGHAGELPSAGPNSMPAAAVDVRPPLATYRQGL